MPWVIVVTSEPESARITIGGRLVRDGQRSYDSAPGESIVVAATARGFLTATMDVSESSFASTAEAMQANVTLTLQPAERANPVRMVTMMETTMETAMETTMETTMETAMETVVMEEATMETVMVEPTMETVMEVSMEATMEAAPPDTVPDNPF